MSIRSTFWQPEEVVGPVVDCSRAIDVGLPEPANCRTEFEQLTALVCTEILISGVVVMESAKGRAN
jgi:hypothetical protein